MHALDHPRRAAWFAAVALAVALVPARRATAELPPLVPRAVIFGNPQDLAPQLSPDGTKLAWSHRGSDGQLNLWVRDLKRDSSWQVTHDKRGIYGARWTQDGAHLLYLHDNDGDENQHLFSLDLATGMAKDMTPIQGARVEGVLDDPQHPDELLVGLNQRDPRVFDLHRLRLSTGQLSLDTQNPGDVIEWATDDNFQVRAATALRTPDAATVIRVRDNAQAQWRDLAVWPFLDAGFDRYRRLIGFTDGGKAMFVQSSMGRNTSAIVKLDLATGRELGVVAQDPRCDVWGQFDATGNTAPRVLKSMRSGKILAVGFEYQKREWKVVDPSVAEDFRLIDNLAGVGTFEVTSRDSADELWVVELDIDTNPGGYALWDRRARRAKALFRVQPELDKLTFAPMKPITFTARDGMTIQGYLTLPVGVPAKNLPLIVSPHGGPWYRDSWGFDPTVQWLANRGYAVINVNFRGSTGFGVKYLNAGDHQFGTGAVQNDITDASRWAVKEGIADPKRVGIMGGSFGGYATLCGLTFTPEVYACGVEVVGPSCVKTLLSSIPAYWAPRRQRWLNRFGDVFADSTLDQRISPLYHADAIRAPLLIGHGVNDPRVKLVESERIEKAIKDKGGDVTLIVYPDEGHGFTRSENNQDFFGRAEEFLAKHLGGRAEPWAKVEGATAEVR